MCIGGRLSVTAQSGKPTYQLKGLGQRERQLIGMKALNVHKVATCKAAKRARGKDKIPARTSDVQEQIETFIQAQSAAKVDMNDMKEFQQRLSAEKVEASRLAYMAAKENKEAKTIENKTKLIDKFTELLNADTTRMEPWAKEAHIRAVTRLGDQLFSKDGAE